MGLFNRLFKDGETDQKSNEERSNQHQSPQGHGGYQGPVLNLSKNEVLNLSKVSESLNKIRAAAGWDVIARGTDYDLDLCAHLCDLDGEVLDVVFYGSKRKKGIYLDGDNLTGAGDGDDENIYVKLKEIKSNVAYIVFSVVIYQAINRKQKFEKVKNAYVRLVDEESHKEICRYNLTENGGKNTAIVVGKLFKDSDENWNFQAIGDYSVNTISSLDHCMKQYCKY